MDWRVSICSISILIGASTLHAGPGSRSGKSTHVALQKCKVAEIPVEATKIVQHSDNKQHCIQEIIESIATSHPQTLPFLVRNLTQACPEEASLIKNSAQKSSPPLEESHRLGQQACLELVSIRQPRFARDRKWERERSRKRDRNQTPEQRTRKREWRWPG